MADSSCCVVSGNIVRVHDRNTNVLLVEERYPCFDLANKYETARDTYAQGERERREFSPEFDIRVKLLTGHVVIVAASPMWSICAVNNIVAEVTSCAIASNWYKYAGKLLTCGETLESVGISGGTTIDAVRGL